MASIAAAYPIGTLMLLQTGNPDVRFHALPVEGTPPDAAQKSPALLILDGQQRLTALYQACHSGRPVLSRDSRGRATRRWYYIDMMKAVDPAGDLDEAVFSMPDDRIRRDFRGQPLEDYSTREKEYAACVFPFERIFDVFEWRMGFYQHWNYDPEKTRFLGEFEAKIVQGFAQYLAPVIVLSKETSKAAVCRVFEKVNTGGVSLTVFELLTASFAADEFQLRQDWERRQAQLRQQLHGILTGVRSTDFLQGIALLASRRRHLASIAAGDSRPAAISCKREDILRLSLEEYKAWADPLTEGFIHAGRMLFTQKIFAERDLPYQTQLVPLAAILTALHEKSGDWLLGDGQRQKLLQWYWCGVLGELYSGAVETRFARDLPEVLAWLEGGDEPSTVKEAVFHPGRLLTLRTRNSAAYKGIYALLLRDGTQDFATGVTIDDQRYFNDAVDIHHIFPRVWCAKHSIPAEQCDSIINKTPIAAGTNRRIQGDEPSMYLKRVQQANQIEDARMDAILTSHVINPSLLRNNDFAGFFAKRREALLVRIEAAMGKAVPRDLPVEAIDAQTVGESDDVPDALDEIEAAG